MAHLLIIAIGPVQDFIAAGRKTRDLWFGSYLLSEVARAVAKAVDQAGGELIFPAGGALAPELPVANKVVARVGAGLDPVTLAAAGRRAAQAKIEGFRDDVLTMIGPQAPQHVDVNLLDQQVADFLEFAAAWYPIDSGDYPASRREGELLLAGRKALRAFAPAHGRDGVAKSALDPARESVVRWPEDGEAADKLRRRLKLKGHEELDGVSLIKRLAEPRRFVSIGRVAVDPFIRRAAAERPDALADLVRLAEEMAACGHPAVESFRDSLDHGLQQYEAFPFDTLLFYDDGRDDRDLDPGEQVRARGFFTAVEQLRQDLGVGELPRYLAVLVADGDQMGRAIGGLPDIEAHQRLSARLAAFAGQADRITRACQGAMVYSGGDDVLAFLPLDRALACADRLRKAFDETMQDVTGETRVSLSVGVAIGHYGEQLHRLLEWGREAERAAKGPRNALAVSLHTRGGGVGRTVVQPWTDNLIEARWKRWVQWVRGGDIPTAAAYELDRLERELRPLWPAGVDAASAATDGAAHDPAERMRDLLQREAGRIVDRRRARRGEHAVTEDRRKQITELIGGKPDELTRVVDELVIARRIADAADVAEGPFDATGRQPTAEDDDARG